MDIGSGRKYPSNALSNFAPHKFVIDGVDCASMEGFLQSLKFKNPEMQKYVCSLVGRKAKFKGKKKKWWKEQKLYWRGETIDRHSETYQILLDKAFIQLAGNKSFRKALLRTNNSPLIHSIGNRNKTVLTEKEFCSRLLKIRERIQNE